MNSIEVNSKRVGCRRSFVRGRRRSVQEELTLGFADCFAAPGKTRRHLTVSKGSPWTERSYYVQDDAWALGVGVWERTGPERRIPISETCAGLLLETKI